MLCELEPDEAEALSANEVLRRVRGLPRRGRGVPAGGRHTGNDTDQQRAPHGLKRRVMRGVREAGRGQEQSPSAVPAVARLRIESLPRPALGDDGGAPGSRSSVVGVIGALSFGWGWSARVCWLGVGPQAPPWRRPAECVRGSRGADRAPLPRSRRTGPACGCCGSLEAGRTRPGRRPARCSASRRRWRRRRRRARKPTTI